MDTNDHHGGGNINDSRNIIYFLQHLFIKHPRLSRLKCTQHLKLSWNLFANKSSEVVSCVNIDIQDAAEIVN